jgi:hypothetical protein
MPVKIQPCDFTGRPDLLRGEPGHDSGATGHIKHALSGLQIR